MYIKIVPTTIKKGDVTMCNLERYNATHMTPKIVYVASFNIGGIKNKQIKKIFAEFEKKRSFKKVGLDFLKNDGIPFYDGDKKRLLTGESLSAKILKQLLSQKAKIVAYAYWLTSHKKPHNYEVFKLDKKYYLYNILNFNLNNFKNAINSRNI